MWRQACIPYFLQMGLTLGKSGRSEDDRSYVHLMARRIVELTAHGSDRHPDAIVELAGKMERGEI